MRDALIVNLLSLVPRNRAASWMGALARSGLSAWATRLFVRAYGVDLSEAEHTLDAYPTLEALFTRRLKPDARPIDDHPDALVSPVDGRCAWVGTTTGGQFELAPGRGHTLSRLLGEPVDGERDVAVLYLSPTDYHRVHVPREGEVVRWRYVPGTLWPVFPAAVASLDELFGRNERVVAEVTTAAGPLYVVLVGAFGVGRMEVAWSDLRTNTDHMAREEAPTPPVPLRRGDDLGVFHLGSTVVLVAPPGAWRWCVQPGEAVRVGRPLAHRPAALTDRG